MDLEILKSLLSKKTRLKYFFGNVQWCNEYYRFPSIVQQIVRAIILTGHIFEGQCAARLGNLDTAIEGSSKDVLYFTLCVFSAPQS